MGSGYGDVVITIAIEIAMLQRTLKLPVIPWWVHIKIRYSVVDVSSTQPGLHSLIRDVAHKSIVAIGIHISLWFAAF
jgi:hypothetical protein